MGTFVQAPQRALAGAAARGQHGSFAAWPHGSLLHTGIAPPPTMHTRMALMVQCLTWCNALLGDINPSSASLCGVMGSQEASFLLSMAAGGIGRSKIGSFTSKLKASVCRMLTGWICSLDDILHFNADPQETASHALPTLISVLCRVMNTT